MALSSPPPVNPPPEQTAAPRGKSRNIRPLVRLAPSLLRYPGAAAAATAALLAAAATTLVVPIAVRRVIDHGFSGSDTLLVHKYFATMLLLVAVLAIASAARFYFVTWLGERVVADLRIRVFAHLLDLSPIFYEQTRTGEVVARLTADTTMIKAAFGTSASVALRNLVMFVGAMILMVLTSPRLSGFTLLAIPLIVLPLVIFGRRVRKLSRTAQDRLADSAALAQEALSAVPVIHAFNQEVRIHASFAEETEDSFEAARRRTRARAFLTAAVIFLSVGSIVAILWLGAKDVLDGTLTAGTLSQFVLYATLAATSMGELSQVWGEIQLAAGAAERLGELLDTRPQIVAPETPRALVSPTRGAIAFNSVSFRYPTRRDQSALEDVSFVIEPGERLAIVGPSGAGKSTVFNLLLRNYDIDQGSIMLDGVELAAADPRAVRERFALVPQESVIFSTSIFENIRFGRWSASEADVLAAAHAARVSEFADGLKLGLRTPVGERGMTLSGGQRQRIAIARAILRDAPVLLLDEATSALDAESEQAVQAALETLQSGRTSLVIAHRLATVRNADRILVLDKGRVIASGSHAELMAGGGLYQRLAALQFSGAEQEMVSAR